MKRQRNTKVAAAPEPDNNVNNTKGGAKVAVEGSTHQEINGVAIKTTKRKAGYNNYFQEEDKGGESSSAATVVERLVGEEEWPWMRGEVDENMSWGYMSPPHWDLEELKGKAHSEVYSDDNWDDDIWGLKAIKEIPNDKL